MKFAWQIADGMSYLSLRKASLSLRDGTTSVAIKKYAGCWKVRNNLLHLIKEENPKNVDRKRNYGTFCIIL